jgi:hypothetical protein
LRPERLPDPDRAPEYTAGLRFVQTLTLASASGRLERWLRFFPLSRLHSSCGSSASTRAYFVVDPDFNVYMDVHQAVNLEIIRAFEREEIEFA